MKEKLLDLKYFYEDHKEKFMPFFKIGISLLSVFLVLGLFLGWFGTGEEEYTGSFFSEGEDFEIIEYQNISKTENGYFPDIVILVGSPVYDKNTVKDISLFIKEKFENEAKILKKQMTGIQIKIYQRKLQYELGLTEVGIYSEVLSNSGLSQTIQLEKRAKKEEYKETFRYTSVEEIPDIQIYDADGILIEEVDVPGYLTDSEYVQLLKLNEYVNIFKDESEAIGFYVYYDLGVVDKKGYKFKTLKKQYLKLYQEAVKRKEYLPKLDKEQIILDYRENHEDVWSNLVTYRGY